MYPFEQSVNHQHVNQKGNECSDRLNTFVQTWRYQAPSHASPFLRSGQCIFTEKDDSSRFVLCEQKVETSKILVLQEYGCQSVELREDFHGRIIPIELPSISLYEKCYWQIEFNGFASLLQANGRCSERKNAQGIRDFRRYSASNGATPLVLKGSGTITLTMMTEDLNSGPWKLSQHGVQVVGTLSGYVFSET